MVEMPRNQTAKVKARTNRLVRAVMNGEDMDKVAEELHVTRRALNYNMLAYDFQSGLAEFLAKDMQSHYNTIDEFLNSDDPKMREAGMMERGKMLRALFPKLVYKKTENESITTLQVEREKYSKLSSKEKELMAELIMKMEKGTDKLVIESTPTTEPRVVESNVESFKPLDEDKDDE